VWLDEAEINIGDSLLDRIQEAVSSVDYLAVILSPSSVKSEWVTKELEMAFYQEVKNKKVKILPLVYKSCEVPLFLKTKAYADFSKEESYLFAFKVLLKLLTIDVNNALLSKLEKNNKNLYRPNKDIV